MSIQSCGRKSLVSGYPVTTRNTPILCIAEVVYCRRTGQQLSRKVIRQLAKEQVTGIYEQLARILAGTGVGMLD